MTPNVQASSCAIERILEEIWQRPKDRLIGIAGIPGAGKSTVAAALAARLPDAIVVPMDGYHLPRRVLTPEMMARRGAADTFDAWSFRDDLRRLREEGVGWFPAFDHAEQDPREKAIRVTQEHRYVLVEGLYLLMGDWELSEMFDFTVFLDCDLEVAIDRVAMRHLACGLCPTLEAARGRANENDRRNAVAILADGCRERAGVVVSSE